MKNQKQLTLVLCILLNITTIFSGEKKLTTPVQTPTTSLSRIVPSPDSPQHQQRPTSLSFPAPRVAWETHSSVEQNDYTSQRIANSLAVVVVLMLGGILTWSMLGNES